MSNVSRSPHSAADTQSSVRIEDATPDDDAAIRRLLRRTPMPGDMTIRYEREPSFFRSLKAMGRHTRVAVGRPVDAPEQVVALGCRSLRRAFVDGEPRPVEYLSQLRVDPEYRGEWLIEPLCQRIRQWRKEDPAPHGYSTITAGNRAARIQLVKRSSGAIPQFRPLTDLYTLAIVLRSWRLRRPTGPTNVTVTRAPEDLDAVAAFLREAGRDRPFSPVYRAADLESDSFLGFDSDNLFVAHRNGEIVGTMGLWDVSGHKQTVVQDYQSHLRWTRPVVNVGLRAAGAQPLPARGDPVRGLYTSMTYTASGHEDAYGALLEAAYQRAAQTDATFLFVGGAEGDPLLNAARVYPHLSYRSTLYTTHWTDDPSQHPALDNRPPALELATL